LDIHTYVKYNYCGSPKLQTPFMDCSSYLMHLEQTASPVLTALMQNCGNHIEIIT
jgi:hypothetical protein